MAETARASGTRQYVLLGILVIALVVYLRYAGLLPGLAGVHMAEPAKVDVAGLLKTLDGINAVNPALFSIERSPSTPDRNLFQYGHRKPPPPTPEQLAEQRRQLEAQEKAAREAKAQEEARQAEVIKQAQAAAAAAAAAAAEMAKNQPPPEALAQQRPTTPPKPPPPAVNFRLVGMVGPDKKVVGVFLEGDKTVLAKKGDVIQGKFVVLKFGAEWAEIGYVDPMFKGESPKRLNLGS